MATKRTATNATVSVAMPPAMTAALDREAKRRQVRPSTVIRDAVAAHLGLDADATAMGSPGRPKNADSRCPRPTDGVG